MSNARPSKREDGWPTRADIRFDTDAERMCRILVGIVEGMGASVALTQAVTSLSDAREAIADHVEGVVRESVWSVGGARYVADRLAAAEAELARLRAQIERVGQCADDFASLPSSNWTGRMVADTFRAALGDSPDKEGE